MDCRQPAGKLLCMNELSWIKSGNTGSVRAGENLIVVVPTYAWRFHAWFS